MDYYPCSFWDRDKSLCYGISLSSGARPLWSQIVDRGHKRHRVRFLLFFLYQCIMRLHVLKYYHVCSLILLAISMLWKTPVAPFRAATLLVGNGRPFRTLRVRDEVLAAKESSSCLFFAICLLSIVYVNWLGEKWSSQSSFLIDL